MESIKVFAPATVANVACGFDVMGFALRDIGDELIIRKTKEPGLVISAIHGSETLSKNPKENVLTVAAQALIEHLDSKPDFGFEFELTKKVKPGSGLGSSASSSAAAVFGLNELLGNPFESKELVPFAMEGERIASGIPHADNVAPSLLGGFILIRSYEPLDVVTLDYPGNLYATVVHPQIEIKTADAKKMLRKQIELKDAITQWGNIGGLVSGLAKADYELIGRSLQDVIAEPIRGMLIPSFQKAKESALRTGALGCSISGSGPSIFALCRGEENAQKVAQSYEELYKSIGLESFVHVSGINTKGAEVLR
ncbi:MAG: homoserine kinase [Balneola sp.]|jgi:homoserine kinase|nr:homoserine kinase [Balneola sp.]MBE79515.1 homoserine kinase [Balneola sp.]HBX67707.1 homoserine kinase [Balneolaceae bacterium]|tara:strand:- start:2035 stop:2967 length:933 start_codon:yes stop_codon:yes gene_type:complete